MKKYILFVCGIFTLFLTSGCTISLARIAFPVDTEFLQVGVGAKFVPCEDRFTFARIAPLWISDDYVAAVNVSGISTSYSNNGIAIGGLLFAREGAGVSAAFVDYNEDHIGVRLGGFVCGRRQRGLQIGLVNMCSDDSYVLQIGLINWAGDEDSPRFLFNGSWGPNEEVSAMIDDGFENEPIENAIFEENGVRNPDFDASGLSNQSTHSTSLAITPADEIVEDGFKGIVIEDDTTSEF